MFEFGKSDQKSNEPLFLKVKAGDTVLMGEHEIAKVISFIEGSRDPDSTKLFQAANIDTGEIHLVHAEEVRGIVSARNS